MTHWWKYAFSQKYYGSQYIRVRKIAPLTGEIIERVNIQLKKIFFTYTGLSKNTRKTGISILC